MITRIHLGEIERALEELKLEIKLKNAERQSYEGVPFFARKLSECENALTRLNEELKERQATYKAQSERYNNQRKRVVTMITNSPRIEDKAKAKSHSTPDLPSLNTPPSTLLASGLRLFHSAPNIPLLEKQAQTAQEETSTHVRPKGNSPTYY